MENNFDAWGMASKLLRTKGTFHPEIFIQQLKLCSKKDILMRIDRDNGESLLQTAVKKRLTKAIKILIEVDDIETTFRTRNIEGYNLLTQIVFRSSLDILKLFVRKFMKTPEVFEVNTRIKLSTKGNEDFPLAMYCLMLHSPDRFAMFRELLKLKPNLSRSFLKSNFFIPLFNSVSNWQRRNKRRTVPNEEFFNACIQQCVNSGGDLLYTRPNGNGILHDCVNFNQPIFLKAVLKHMKKVSGSHYVKSIIDEEGIVGFSPLLLCCRYNFDVFMGECRTECARHLIKYGADVNFVHHRLRFTPLLFCLGYEEYNESKGELACLLLDAGADHTVRSSNEVCCIYYAILSHAVPVVKKMVELGYINFEKHLVNSRRFPIVLAADNYIVSRDSDESNLPDLEILLFFQKAGSPTACALFSICFCLNHKYERKLLKQLLDQGFEANADALNHLPLLFLATLFKDVAAVSMLLKHGADPNKTFRPTVCLNHENNIHRWIEFETLQSYFEFHNTDPTRRKCRCHICLRTLSNTDKIVACKEGDQCDCRVCSNCMFYTESQDSKGTSLFEFGKRCNSYHALALTKFYACTEVGKRLISQGMEKYSVLFLNAGLADVKTHSRLTPEVFEKLGLDFSDFLLLG